MRINHKHRLLKMTIGQDFPPSLPIPACFRPGGRRIAVTILPRLPSWLYTMTLFVRSTEYSFDCTNERKVSFDPGL